MDKQEWTIKMQKHLRAVSAGPRATTKVSQKNKVVRPVTATGNKQVGRQAIEELLRKPHMNVPPLALTPATDRSTISENQNTTSNSPQIEIRGTDEELQSSETLSSIDQCPTKDERPVKTSQYPTLLAWQDKLTNHWDEEFTKHLETPDSCKKTNITEGISSKEKYKQFCQHFEVEPISYISRHIGDRIFRMKHRCITANGIKPLAFALQLNTSIHTLDLTDNHIDSLGAEHLAYMLKENQTMVNLNLSNNLIGSNGLAAICDMLESNTTLKSLSIAGNHLNDRDGFLLIEPLKNNMSLTCLDLSHNEFSITGAIHIGRALVVNDSLTDLDLSWNSIRRQGAVAIANALRINKTLEVLDLAWNGFGVEGVTALQRSLTVNKTIKMLDLSNNRLNDEAVHKLGMGLKKNVSIETLSLNRNSFSDEGVENILKVLEKHPALSFLSLEGLNISKRTTELIQTLTAKKEKVILYGDIGRLNRDLVLVSLRGWFDRLKSVRSSQLNDVVRQYDVTCTGAVTADDFKVCLRAAGFILPKGYIDLLLHRLEGNHKGQIAYRNILSIAEQNQNKDQIKQRPFPLLMNTQLEDVDKD